MKYCQSLVLILWALAIAGISTAGRADVAASLWRPFTSTADTFATDSATNLRKLNEPHAGDGGFIAARDGQFIHRSTRQSVHDPWTIRRMTGHVSLTRLDAAALKVTALDANGSRLHKVGSASRIKLEPSTIYYLIER